MSKRRGQSPDHSISIRSPSPQKVIHIVHIENQMRGLIQAARAPRARRFVTPSTVQSQINATINRELLRNETVSESSQGHGRKGPQVTVSGVPENRRNTLHHSPVLRALLPKPVRDVILGSERALECTRRETRRQIMFALRRTGKAGRKNRKARWTADSRISCKR